MCINVSSHEETIINQLVEAGGHTSTSEWLQAIIFEGKGEPLDDVVARLKTDVRQHYQLD